MTKSIPTSLKKNKSKVLFHLNHPGQSDTEFRLSSSFKDRPMLLNRFLWKDYSRHEMDISTANATHIVLKYRGAINPYALVKSIDILLGRHKVLNSSIETFKDNLYLIYKTKQKPVFHEVFIKGKTPQIREKEAARIADDLIWEE